MERYWESPRTNDWEAPANRDRRRTRNWQSLHKRREAVLEAYLLSRWLKIDREVENLNLNLNQTIHQKLDEEGRKSMALSEEPNWSFRSLYIVTLAIYCSLYGLPHWWSRKERGFPRIFLFLLKIKLLKLNSKSSLYRPKSNIASALKSN